MMSPVLPIALAFAALALAHVQFAWRKIGIAAALVAVIAASIVLFGARLQPELAFTLCWVTVIASAGVTISATRPRPGVALALALATGASTGLVAASTTGGLPLIEAAPAALLLVLVTVRSWKGLRLLVQIVSAWMLAVALLSAAIPLVATPGYQSDHRE